MGFEFMGVVGSIFAQNQKVNIVKWSTPRAGSDAIKIKALRPSYQKLVFWATLVPPRATGATFGNLVQIWSQKLRLGYIFHVQVLSRNLFLRKKDVEPPTLTQPNKRSIWNSQVNSWEFFMIYRNLEQGVSNIFKSIHFAISPVKLV